MPRRRKRDSTMGIDADENEGMEGHITDPSLFARSYQLDALERALKRNTIVFFETGTGKTLIAVMLLRRYAHLIRMPSPYIAVFLVPTVILVAQQGEVVATHTDLKVGKYYGEMGVDFWDASVWKQQTDEHEVLVMTPQILLSALRHKFLSLSQIKVLIFDECHNARGKHPYACIMTEFYHRELELNSPELPRIFGMTASPIKAKVSSSQTSCSKQIMELENLMNSKVFTESDTVLAQYINFSTPKLKFYEDVGFPQTTFEAINASLARLKEKHEIELCGRDISESVAVSAKRRLEKLIDALSFCLTELGICLAMKAAEVFSCEESDVFLWAQIDASSERVVKAFSSDAVKVFSAFKPFGPTWSVRDDRGADVANGFLTSKVVCLIETLLEYREKKDMRCIIFVERIITAIVIRSILNDLLQESVGWRTEYTAGNTSMLQSQSRKVQNSIVDEFRSGKVNIIVATSMLEEGLDVQSCNLVIRFDPSTNICSFIQSRGRARMQDSDFVLMLRRGDNKALERVRNYLASGKQMRKESLANADIPCGPLEKELYDEPFYQVEATGAIMTLSSSVSLLYFYCSRLPSDGYFKPYPRITIDKELQSCTILLPSSSPVQTITVHGDSKNAHPLKQLACLEACKKLHKVGALTDHLVPEIIQEEAEVEAYGFADHIAKCTRFFPPELIGHCSSYEPVVVYHCYLITLLPDFEYEVKFDEVMLAVNSKLDDDLEKMTLDLEVGRGIVAVRLKYVGEAVLSSKQVALCQGFQVTLLTLLLYHKLDDIHKFLPKLPAERKGSTTVFDYLLLPPTSSMGIDWRTVSAVCLENSSRRKHECSSVTGVHSHCVTRNNGLVCCCALEEVVTKGGSVCCCLLENSVVMTPHNGALYCIDGTMDGVDGNSLLKMRDGAKFSYKEYYKKKHDIDLRFVGQNLLRANHIFNVHNHVHWNHRILSSEEGRQGLCLLPPEICVVIMAPMSISTMYSFSFIPSVMHWIESHLLAARLKIMPFGRSMQVASIPTAKILEAITTKKCREKYNLESLETIGDSFLKYAATQHVFKAHQNVHEGLLSVKRQKIISNASLCKLGCEHKITGFIRNEPFDPKKWVLPGANCENVILNEEFVSSNKFYLGPAREIKSKAIADVVEALIGVFLLSGGELAAVSFMSWLGIDVDFTSVPYKRKITANPEKYVNIKYFESLLQYSFRDASLLVEALTHGSYMMPEVPGCYQRLEFLGDGVLDYLITIHLYEKNPELSPGLITDLRSAQVNNNCYAMAAVKANLHKHILHASQDLQRHIYKTLQSLDEATLDTTFGWESDSTFPKVLGDVIESLAGAILVDSGYDKEVVFRSIRPLLEPLIVPETLRIHPVRELYDVCQKKRYGLNKYYHPTTAEFTVEVEANGTVHKATRSDHDKKTSKKHAFREVLESLKGSGHCSS